MKPATSALTLSALLLVLGLPLAATSATLENRRLAFQVDDTTGAWQLTDRRSGVVWTSNPQPRFAEAVLQVNGARRTVSLRPAAIETSRRELALTFRPLPEQPAATLRVRVTTGSDPDTLELVHDAEPALGLESLRLLDEAFATTDAEGGYLVSPTREGLLIPANSGLAFTHRFDTYAYEGCHMAMFGVVKAGSGALITWTDPYVAVDIRSALTNAAPAAGAQRLTTSVTLRKSARTLQLRLVSPADPVAFGVRYRAVAKERGLRVTWDRKIRENPVRAKYLGASNYKLWSALDRSMNEESTQEKSVRVNWTFDEAAQIAEHLRRDLLMDRVLFHMGGWIHRGYDNQHPDVLPAAPECGGSPGLANCARRVRDLGYLFCLHDNYQDIYRDSPSWSEQWLNRNPDGTPTRGGVWAGGRAYVTCARMALELARRPANLPAVRALTGADSYFIDTTYAAGLYECFAPEHPMTRADDLHWKVELSDYARSVFGSFGSECGREWAIPHADFFEGLTGVSGQGFHDTGLQRKLGAAIVPLFEVVYRDCIALHGKYGYNPATAADYVLHHAAIGRPLHYHNIPPHLYWKDASADDVVPVTPAISRFEATGPRTFRLGYAWDVRARPAAGWRVFVHFVDATDQIVFQNDHAPTTPDAEWSPGRIETGPFDLQAPAGNGSYEVRIGLFDPATGRRARLAGGDVTERSTVLGRLVTDAAGVHFTPESGENRNLTRDPGLFMRGDGGWTEGRHPYDRFVKNTHELLSPLHELTGRMLPSSHEFLDGKRRVQRTVFGEGRSAYEVVVNGGDTPLRRTSRFGGEVDLPPGGLLIEGPEFTGFVATRWGGREFAGPTCFTLRAIDGRSLDRSRRVHVFHAFGDPGLHFRGGDHRVPREEELAFP